MKICLVDYGASHYREEIFKKMEDSFNIDFYFASVKSSVKTMDVNKLRGFKGWLPVKRFLGKIYFEGMQKLLRDDYDIYILDGDLRNIGNWCFLLKSRFTKKRVLLWTHGWYGHENTIRRFLKRFFYKMTDGLVLYGDYAKKLMVDKEGFKADSIFVVHNSLSYYEQLAIRQHITNSTVYHDHFNNNNPNLIFIGRLTPIKKLDMILYAVKRLLANNVGVNVTFVGDGIERAKLESLTKELNIEYNVWFYGASYDESVNATLIYNADLCISPGNVGLTSIHVLTFGTPVITHNNFTMQMPEFEAVLKGKTGDFFVENDVDSLVKTISRWLSEHTDRDSVRKNCYDVIDHEWNPDFQIKVFHKVFNNN